MDRLHMVNMVCFMTFYSFSLVVAGVSTLTKRQLSPSSSSDFNTRRMVCSKTCHGIHIVHLDMSKFKRYHSIWFIMVIMFILTHNSHDPCWAIFGYVCTLSMKHAAKAAKETGHDQFKAISFPVSIHRH